MADSMPANAPSTEELTAALAAKSLELEALQNELDETNRGVVALYAELDTQAQQLRQATDLKSRFLNYMSHEFRTPIAAVISLTGLLLDEVDGSLNEEQRKQISFIRSTAGEFSEMVNDLLDLAKVEAGRVDISPAWFEMVDLFSALRGMFKPVLVNPAVSLVFEEPPTTLAIYTDDQKLSQILRNFISNALKFTVQGEVRVSVAKQGEDFVCFSVADTGIGIASQFHHAIFHDFAQIDSPIQKRLRGTGLGLSLSKRLAELIGGTVSFKSELGCGSTFSVAVPLRFTSSAETSSDVRGE